MNLGLGRPNYSVDTYDTPGFIKYLKEDGKAKTLVRTKGSAKYSKKAGERTLSELKNYWMYYSKEGTVFAALNSTAFNTILVGSSIQSVDEDAKQLIEDICFNVDLEGALLEATLHSLVFGDAYIEKRRVGGGDIVKLHPVDPQTMIINYNEFGDVESYQQEIGGRLIEPVIKPEDIIHIRFLPIPGSPYGVSMIEPNVDIINRKLSIEEAIYNAMIRHGTGKWVIYVGNEKDGQTPPDDVMDKIAEKFENINEINEVVLPWFIKLEAVDEKGIEGVDTYYDYFQTQLVVGLMCPEEALGLGRGILHPDTEIFTKSKGFVPIEYVEEGDEILTYNSKSNTLEYQPNRKTWEFDLDEELFNIKAQTFNLLCTQDHRVCYRGQHKEEFDICQAQELPTRFEMIVGGMNWNGIDVPIEKIPSIPIYYGNRFVKHKLRKWEPEQEIRMDDWLDFLGWFISEGYTSINKDGYTVGIRQFNKDNLAKIWECVNKLPFKANLSEDRVTIHNKQLALYLEPLGKSHEKYIPSHIKELSPRQLSILYESLMLGDGCENNYFTSSKQLADDLQEIILKMGYGSTIYIRDRIGDDVTIHGETNGKVNYLQYTITKNEKNLTPEICIKDTKGHKDMHELIPYKGKAYCVTVDNGLILTRLDGKCVITGNSTEGTARVKAIMYERMIKAYQQRISQIIRTELFNEILIKYGFVNKESEVKVKGDKSPVKVELIFNSVTEEDEALRAKWLGNLLRGFPDGNMPFTRNEIRAFFNLPQREDMEDVPVSGEDEEDKKPEESKEEKPKEEKPKSKPKEESVEEEEEEE